MRVRLSIALVIHSVDCSIFEHFSDEYFSICLQIRKGSRDNSVNSTMGTAVTRRDLREVGQSIEETSDMAYNLRNRENCRFGWRSAIISRQGANHNQDSSCTFSAIATPSLADCGVERNHAFLISRLN